MDEQHIVRWPACGVLFVHHYVASSADSLTNMEELVHRLKGLAPTVNEICRISGCPGVSVGILYRNEVIFQQGYGYRDVERKLVPDEHTIYYLASLSKSFTAALIGILVERGKLQWTTPITKILPRANHKDRTIHDQANMVDWMSHRTGLAPKNLIWSQEFGHHSLKRRDALPTISYLEKIFDFRTRWLYNNWGYAVADEVVTHVTGDSWGTMLENEIFEPLGMSRTITKHHTKLENVAEAYMALANGKPHHLPRPFQEDGQVMEGAAAVQSSVHDLLIYYAEFMRAAKDQAAKQTTSLPGSPLKQVTMLLKPHIALDPNDSSMKRGYGLGWVRTELPNTLGAVGMNPGFVREMPVVGKGLNDRIVCLYHQGNTNTFQTSVHMLPESQSAIIVLTNSMANNDTADWLGELFLQTLLDVPIQDQNDYVKLASVSAKRSLARWSEMRKELKDARTPNTKPKSLDSYVGKYWNEVSTYHIEVLLRDGSLLMCFQGDHDQLYDLSHYENDVFSWLLSHDEDVRLGRYPVSRTNFYLFDFKSKPGSNVIDSLIWVNDAAVPGGEKFIKEAAAPDCTTIEGPA